MSNGQNGAYLDHSSLAKLIFTRLLYVLTNRETLPPCIGLGPAPPFHEFSASRVSRFLRSTESNFAQKSAGRTRRTLWEQAEALLAAFGQQKVDCQPFS